MARKKKEMTAEELVKGLRRRGGHLPTKASEAARKKREEEEKRKARNGSLKGAKFE